MKLKLDLHPIYNDTQKIEAALQAIIDEAVATRATEVEIIPGKGSGALKKSVIRFLDRPEIKARYHRIEKDGDNWGRLFVHFRHPARVEEKAATVPLRRERYTCFCCQATVDVSFAPDDLDGTAPFTIVHECPSCG